MTMPSVSARESGSLPWSSSATARATALPTAFIGCRRFVARVATRSRPTFTSAPVLTRCGSLSVRTVSTGERLNLADKRHAIELAFATWPDLESAAGLPRQVGCSQALCPQGPWAGDNQLSPARSVWSAKTASCIRQVVVRPIGRFLRRSIRMSLGPEPPSDSDGGSGAGSCCFFGSRFGGCRRFWPGVPQSLRLMASHRLGPQCPGLRADSRVSVPGTARTGSCRWSRSTRRTSWLRRI